MSDDRIAKSWKDTQVEDDLCEIRNQVVVRQRAHGLLERAMQVRDFWFFSIMTTITFLLGVVAGALEYYGLDNEVKLFAVISPEFMVMTLALYRYLNYAGRRLGHINTSNNLGSIASRITVMIDTKPEARNMAADAFYQDVDHDFGNIVSGGQYVPQPLLDRISEELLKKQN